MIKCSSVVVGGVLASVLSASRVALADVADLEGLLDQSVVTTASKSAESVDQAPAVSTVIPAEELQRYGIRTLAEAINFLSLGVISSDRLAQGDIGARGVTLSRDRGNHFLLLLNGHVMNEQLAGSVAFDRGAGIPIEIVDHIEVIIGPGSVLYGSNAMLGVINVITKRAETFSGTHIAADASPFSSERFALEGGYQLSLFGSPCELTFGVDYYRRRGESIYFVPEDVGIDPATGQPTRFSRSGAPTGVWGGSAEHIEADTPSAIVRFVRGGLELTLHASSDRRSRPTTPLTFDDPSNVDVIRTASLDLAYTTSVSAVTTITARAYGDYFDSSSTIVSPQVALCRVPGVNCEFIQEGFSRSGGTEVRGSFDWNRDARFVTMLGLDTRYKSVESASHVYQADSGVRLPGSYGVFSQPDVAIGTYLQQTFEMTNWLTLNGGVRADHDRQVPFVVSPRLAVVTRPWKGGTLKAIYAEAYRAPSQYESLYSEPIRIRPGDLRPEKVQSMELSLEQRLGAEHVRFGVFNMHWRDLIELQPLSATERQDAINNHLTDLDPQSSTEIDQLRNITSITNYGWNASLEGMGFEQRLRFGLNVTGVLARKQEGASDTPITIAPRLFGNLRAEYSFGDAYPTLGAAMFAVGARAADRAYDSGFRPTPIVPAQATVQVSLTGKGPLIPGLSYSIVGRHTTATYEPYVVGPVQVATAHNPTAQLLPAEKDRLTLGLRYDF